MTAAQFADNAAHDAPFDDQQSFISVLSQAFRYASVPMVVRTERGAFVEANEAYCRMVGYSRDELAALDLAALFHPDDAPPSLDRAAALASGEIDVYGREHHYRRKDGTTFWAAVTFSALRDESGRFCGLLSIIQDISDRKRLEAELHARETQIGAIVAQLPASIYRLDSGVAPSGNGNQKRMVFAGSRFEAALDLLGGTDGMPLEEYFARVHPDDLPALLDEDRAAERRGRPFDVEYRLRAADGSWVWVHDRSMPEFDDHGAVVAWHGVLLDVADRKHLEAALQENEARLQTITEKLPVALYSLEPGPTGRYTYANPLFEEMTGLATRSSTQDLQAWLARVHPDDLAAVREIDQRSGKTGLPFDAEYRLLNASDEWMWVHNRGISVCDDRGRVVAWHGVLIDVTERKRLEAALWENEVHLQTIADQLPVALYRLEPKLTGRYTYVSPQFSQLTGLNPHQIERGLPALIERIHPEDVETFHDAVRLARATGTAFEAEYRLRDCREEWVWVHNRAVRVFDDHGNPLDWVGVLLDITERKHLESSLRQSEAELRAIVEQLPVAIYRIEEDSDNYSYVSPRFSELTGVFPDRVPDSYGKYVARIHPDDRAPVITADRTAVQTTSLFASEYRLLAPDGSWRWVHDQAIPFQDAQGMPYAWLGVLLDITDRRHLEAALLDHETHLKTIVENLPAALYRLEIGPTQRYTYGSSRFEAMTGLSMSERIVDSAAYRARIHPDDLDAIIALDLKAAESGQPFDGEYRMLGADGSWVWVHDRSRVALDAEGQPHAWYGILIDVTERKELEASLHEREALFRSLFEDASIGMTVCDSAGTIVLANPAMGRLLDREPAALVGHSVGEFSHPEDYAYQREMRPRLHAGEIESIQLEKRYLRRDGSQFWGLLNIAPVLGEDGRVLASTGQVQDITGRKEAEAALRRSEVRFRTIFEESGVGMALIEIDNCIVLANTAFERFLGYPPGGLVGATVRDFTHPDDIETQMAFRRQMRSGDIDTYQMEKRYLRTDGAVVWGLLSVTGIRDGNGPLQAIIAQVQDITARKEAEAALRESQARIHALVQHDPDVMIIVDQEMHVVYVSPAAENAFGVPVESLPGTVAENESVAHPEDWLKVLDLFDLVAGRPDETASTEVRLLNRDRGWLWFQITIANLQSDPGINGYLLNLRDVTEQKQAELATATALRAQQSAIAELERLNQSKTRFLSTISHEFRTPLTAIIGFSELLEAAGADDPTIAEDAAIIHREASRLNRMVGDVLLIERIEAGRLDLHVRPIDLNQLTRDVVDACRPLSATHRFALELDPGLPPIAGDSDRLAQAMTNLVSNAIKYSPPDSIVSVHTQLDGGSAIMAVGDEGVGIAPEDAARIFDRFERVEHGMAGRIGGTGLGLAIAREIANLHQGDLWVESEVGKGSTFCLRIPLTDPADFIASRSSGHDGSLLTANA